MDCIKIAMLLTLIPLALRGSGSILGNVVVVVVAVVPSPEQQPPGYKIDGDSPSSADHQGRRHTAFTRRRFGTGGGDGFFNEDKRFSPTGSNPLHNL
uniref:Uncharacterized protein n=1 Tax=Leersia perrieri TaxID=77586 RepID=A0A0D9WDA4_9ORYZ